MDEPESLGRSLLPRASAVDNLVLSSTATCSGPVVRSCGNGRIIQRVGSGVPRCRMERDQGDLGRLLGSAAGARQGRPAAQAHGGMRRRRPSSHKVHGAFVREHFFGKLPQLAAMVIYVGRDIWRLNRGGHDPIKVHAAYAAAMRLGTADRDPGRNKSKGYNGRRPAKVRTSPLAEEDGSRCAPSRERFNIPIPDDQISSAPYFAAGRQRQMAYLHAAASGAGGYMPSRRAQANP